MKASRTTGRTTGSRRTAPAVPPTTARALPAVAVRRGALADTPLLLEPEVDALALAIAPAVEGEEGVQPRSGAADAAARYGIDLGDVAEQLEATGAAGETRTVHLPRASRAADDTPGLPWEGLPRRVVLVGIGQGTPADLRQAGAGLARAVTGLRDVVTTVGADTGPAGARAFAEGYLLGAYRHPSLAATPPPEPARRLLLLGRYDERAVDQGVAHGRATWIARELTSTPSSTKNPAWLADRAATLAEAAGLTVEVLEPAELARRGFGGLLAVGGGSATGPRLVTVRYEPRGRARRHVVVVGKGITYDTGGISIKPRESMVAMKTDMAGAAVALTTVLGAAAAGSSDRVTALLPLAENAVGASSYRPGDVLSLYGGTTVEIANTDAEGRLVLGDALAHAVLDLAPDVVVDVATLTGAATLGLGRRHGALFTPDDVLARELVAAGDAAGEPLWRMPLVPDYLPATASTVADLRHVPTDQWVGGGAVTAALFLQQVLAAAAARRGGSVAGASGVRWAHLDVAGPARASSSTSEGPEGATGFGSRALLRWLES